MGLPIVSLSMAHTTKRAVAEVITELLSHPGVSCLHPGLLAVSSEGGGGGGGVGGVVVEVEVMMGWEFYCFFCILRCVHIHTYEQTHRKRF